MMLMPWFLRSYGTFDRVFEKFQTSTFNRTDSTLNRVMRVGRWGQKTEIRRDVLYGWSLMAKAKKISLKLNVI